MHEQASQESGLSGELNLGHYGVTQANSFEAVNINTQGAELITPFAKLAVPYKVYSLLWNRQPICEQCSVTFSPKTWNGSTQQQHMLAIILLFTSLKKGVAIIHFPDFADYSVRGQMTNVPVLHRRSHRWAQPCSRSPHSCSSLLRCSRCRVLQRRRLLWQPPRRPCPGSPCPRATPLGFSQTPSAAMRPWPTPPGLLQNITVEPRGRLPPCNFECRWYKERSCCSLNGMDEEVLLHSESPCLQEILACRKSTWAERCFLLPMDRN